MYENTHDQYNSQVVTNSPQKGPHTKNEAWPSQTPIANISWPITTNVFDVTFPGVQYANGPDKVISGRKYISEEFEGNNIQRLFKRWISPAGIEFKLPILISAQTGAGKNYFITNSLREFAQSHNEKILYICNRVALNFQQKQELAKLTGRSLSIDGRWEDSEEFGCITVLTYHTLLAHLANNDDAFFTRFQYIVLDECHFFYSDALFNISTGNILQSIPRKFINSYRIYMTATPDSVMAPIYSAELDAMMEAGAYLNSKNKPGYLAYRNEFTHLELLPQIQDFTFQRDFSAYSNILFFSRNMKANRFEFDDDSSEGSSINFNVITKEIKDKLSASGRKATKKKWVIFVNSKKYGQQLQKELERDKISAQYIDRNSRLYDSGEKTWLAWTRLQRTGKIDCDVLIATSVLDNGFSIKDPSVGNIVLFTDDKTEFLQELGRVRLAQDQHVNIYIAKASNQFELSPQQNKAYQKVLAPFYEDNTDQMGKCATAINLWHTGSDSRRGLISLVNAGNGRLGLHTNDMAYYRLKTAEQEIKEYEALLLQNESKAPILYKLRWLSEDPQAVTFENMEGRFTDLDNLETQIAEKIKLQFEPFLNQPMAAPSSEELNESSKRYLAFSKAIEEICSEYGIEEIANYQIIETQEGITNSDYLSPDSLSQIVHYLSTTYLSAISWHASFDITLSIPLAMWPT